MFVLELISSHALTLVSDQAASFYLEDAERTDSVVRHEPVNAHDGTIFMDEDFDVWILWPLGRGQLDEVVLFDQDGGP